MDATSFLKKLSCPLRLVASGDLNRAVQLQRDVLEVQARSTARVHTQAIQKRYMFVIFILAADCAML